MLLLSWWTFSSISLTCCLALMLLSPAVLCSQHLCYMFVILLQLLSTFLPSVWDVIRCLCVTLLLACWSFNICGALCCFVLYYLPVSVPSDSNMVQLSAECMPTYAVSQWDSSSYSSNLKLRLVSMGSISVNISHCEVLPFCVKRSRGKMYIGHGRLRVCVSVCLSLAAFPHYCTDPDLTWGNSRGCPLVVHCWVICNRCTGFVAMTT